MTSPDSLTRLVQPLEVTVKNWAESAKPPYVKNTTVKTYTLNAAAGAAGQTQIQIATYEETRYRLVIIPIDAAITIQGEQPGTTPDSNVLGTPNNGGYLPVAQRPFEFYGPDAWWINSVGTQTRVTVIKEYC